MPLKTGKSDETVSSNISEMLDHWARTGSLGKSKPKSKKKAQDQATAIAMEEAGKSRHSGDMFLGGASAHIQRTAQRSDPSCHAYTHFEAMEAMGRLPIDRLAERIVNAPAMLFEASGGALRGRKFQGIQCFIENPAGSTRKGKNSDGTPWQTVMRHDYGYIAGVDGADGDELDVFLGPDQKATHAYVVHQRDPETLDYDEDKVMLGFNSQEEALEAYRANYDRDMPLEGVTPAPMDNFKNALKDAKNDVFRWKQRRPKMADVTLDMDSTTGDFSSQLGASYCAQEPDLEQIMGSFSADELDRARRASEGGGKC